MSKSITIPLQFFRAIGEKQPLIRIYWIKWLSDYTDELLRPDFPSYFMSTMTDKKLDYGTIKEAYEFGIPFFKDGLILTEQKKTRTRQNVLTDPETKKSIQDCLEHLNSVTGATFTASKSNSEFILARLKEGYTINDFKAVINRKAKQWLGTPQAKYLRPITLFQQSKFENYLNEPESQPTATEQHRTSSNLEKLSNASKKAKQLLG